MFAWFKRLAAPIAAVALFAFAPAAQAVTVQYYTVGRFLNGTASGITVLDNATLAETTGALTSPFLQTVAGGAQASSFVTIGGTSLGFTSSGQVTLTDVNFDSTGVATTSFGFFQAVDAAGVAIDPLGDLFTGLQFALDIYQVLPEVGDTSFVGSVTGSFYTAPPDGNPGSPKGVAKLVFNPFTQVVGSASVYSVALPSGELQFQSVNAFINPAGITQLGGSVAVPLPGVAVAGLWMLGGVGSLGLLKRRRLATVA